MYCILQNLIEQLASNESGLTTTSTTSTATVKEMSTNHLPEQMEHKREINAQPTYLTRHFIRVRMKIFTKF